VWARSLTRAGGSKTRLHTVNYVRFAWPRAIFFTLRFCDPRAYSRGLSGFSALRFLRDARLAFLRSSLLKLAVLAISAVSFLSEEVSGL
jgi:hypothetical protein